MGFRNWFKEQSTIAKIGIVIGSVILWPIGIVLLIVYAVDTDEVTGKQASHSRKASKEINEEIPEEMQDMLLSKEKALHFAFIDVDQKVGCAGKERAKSWILVSNRRVLYDASVKQGESYTQQNGEIPLGKISFVSVSTSTTTEGCSGTRRTSQVTISSGGGSVVIPVASEEEAKRLQKAISGLVNKREKST